MKFMAIYHDQNYFIVFIRSSGLRHLYSEIGVTDQKEKASFDYLRTLKGQDNMQLAVNFQQLIAGPVSYDNGNEIIETR